MTQAAEDTLARGGLSAWLRAVRPDQWTKNIMQGSLHARMRNVVVPAVRSFSRPDRTVEVNLPFGEKDFRS